MRVAIDSGPLESGHKIRGIGFYTKSLIGSLQELAPRIGRLKIDSFDFWSDQKRLETGVYDIVHYPYFDPFRITLPKEKVAKIVVTIHDLIPLLYPEQYKPGIRGKLNLLRQKRLLQTVDAVITDTEASKKDIVRFFDIPEKKVNSIYLAPRTIFKPNKDRKDLSNVQKKYSLPNKFVLYVGDVNYNKNISTLIKACDIADTPIVIVGKQANEIDKAKLEVKGSGIRDRIRKVRDKPHPELEHFVELEKLFESKNVIRLGFVDDDDLVKIYNLATVYCQPSLSEGFGLPPLEAMASGTAVVASKTQALVEILGDAALFADHFSAKDMSKKIETIINDAYVRASLIRQGEKRVSGFSWERTARQTFAVYEKVFQDERYTARKLKNRMMK